MVEGFDNIAEWTGKSFAETQAMAQPAGVEIADEEVCHDAPLRLLTELRDQGKARQEVEGTALVG